MTAKRTLLVRRRKDPITAEMVTLFRRGRTLQALGAAADAEGALADEFRTISKRLDWVLLKRGPHEVSIFDDLGGEPPDYMAARNSEQHPDFNGWYSGREFQKRLAGLTAA
jgi:hypothetical protein